jgi:hypothetical protein
MFAASHVLGQERCFLRARAPGLPGSRGLLSRAALVSPVVREFEVTAHRTGRARRFSGGCWQAHRECESEMQRAWWQADRQGVVRQQAKTVGRQRWMATDRAHSELSKNFGLTCHDSP